MKNKFWYSKKQDKICFGKNYVKTKNGWERYSEWCSSGQNSNWDDAVLILETNDKPQIKSGNR